MSDIPSEMKQATWLFYIRATDINPTICISGIRAYIMHLKNLFHVAGITDYDNDLNLCIRIVNNAWYELTENHNWGKAFQDAMPAMDKLEWIAFDKRFSTIDMTSFKGVKK